MSATDLAKRAIACKGWKWLPGMRGNAGGYDLRIGSTWTEDYPPSTYILDGDILRDCDDRWEEDECNDAVPDLTDPATIGCLLHLVREAWGDVGGYVRPQPYVFSDGPKAWVAVLDPSEGDGDVMDYHECLEFEAATEAEALVAALESAP